MADITAAQKEANRAYLAGDIDATEYTRRYFSGSANTSGYSDSVQQKYGFGDYGQIREFGEQNNTAVDWDPTSKNVTFGDKQYTPEQLTQMGGVISNDRWVLPKDVLASLLPQPAPAPTPAPAPAPSYSNTSPTYNQALPPAATPDWVPSNVSTNDTIVRPTGALPGRSQQALNQLKYDDNPDAYRRRLQSLFDSTPAEETQRNQEPTTSHDTVEGQSDFDKLKTLVPRKKKSGLESLLTIPKNTRSTLIAP